MPSQQSQQQQSPAAQREPRAFRVKRGQVGPYPAGHVFTEDDFRKRTPLAGSDAERAQVDPATYHDELIGRLIALDAIEPAPAAAAVEPVPVGPENASPSSGNAAIARATVETVKARAAQEANLQGQRDEAASAAQAQSPTPVGNVAAASAARK